MDRKLVQALQAIEAGDYASAAQLIESRLTEIGVNKLPPQKELMAKSGLATSYAALGEFKKAAKFLEGCVELCEELHGLHSDELVETLTRLYDIRGRLEEWNAAHEAAQAIVEIYIGRDMVDDLRFGNALLMAGNALKRAGRFAEALVSYKLAKPMLAQAPYSEDYRILHLAMATCHVEMSEWNEAFSLYKTAITFNKDTLPWAVTVGRIGLFYAHLKQYERAAFYLERSYTVHRTILGEQNCTTISIKERLHEVFDSMNVLNRHQIDVGHAYRMCNSCEKIAEEMPICSACLRAWYCTSECQLKDWKVHKPNCHVCVNCEVPMDREKSILRCSICKIAKYCGTECQREDWPEHKLCCKAPPK